MRLLALFFSALAAAPPRVTVGDAPAGDIRYVLARRDAWLQAGDQRVRAAIAQTDPNDVRVFRLLDEASDHVEVESLPSVAWGGRGGECTAGDPFLTRGYRLRFRVERAALVRVLAREVGWSFEDGTSVRLMPGVPAGTARADGTTMLAADGFARYLKLPDDAVATAYVPQPPFQPHLREASPTHQLTGESAPTVGGAAVTKSSSLPTVTGGGAAATKPSSRLTLTGVREVEGGALATLSGPCSEWVVRTGLGEVVPVADDRSGIGGLIGTSGKAAPKKIAAAGMAVWWPDGSPAGTVHREQKLNASTLAPSGDLVCLARTVAKFAEGATGEEPTLRLCFRPGDLKDE